MSHKLAKRRRKLATDPTLSPIQATLTINYHQGGHVTTSFPTNIALTMHMIGEALKAIGQKCRFEEPSPIVQVPLGTKLVG